MESLSHKELTHLSLGQDGTHIADNNLLDILQYDTVQL